MDIGGIAERSNLSLAKDMSLLLLETVSAKEARIEITNAEENS